MTSGVPEDFNADQYMAAVKEVCKSNRVCLSQAQDIFNSFGVMARKIDEMFSLMLCDKEMKRKILEDFSCNSLLVEIQSWKNQNVLSCEFEPNWEKTKKEYCPE